MAKKVSKNTIEKYKLLIDEWFVNGFNGAKAYRKYYPNIRKDETAIVNFSKIKSIEEIDTYIKEKQEEAAKVIEVTHEGVLGELKRWIEADITETIGLTPDEVKLLPIDLRRLITKYKHKKETRVSLTDGAVITDEYIELHFVSKERALEMVNRHIGFYEADNKQKIPDVNYEELTGATLMELWNARKRD